MAEDLGVIPDFVRDSLRRLSVPGCKVLRWERDWHQDGQPFLDPRTFSPVSLAMTGTHDTPTMAEWWDEAEPAERAAVLTLPSLHALVRADMTAAREWDARLRDAMLETAFSAGSDDVFFMIHDLFGWRDRVNTPATVGPHNWTWRLPWPVDVWPEMPEAAARAAWCRAAAEASGRPVRPATDPDAGPGGGLPAGSIH